MKNVIILDGEEVMYIVNFLRILQNYRTIHKASNKNPELNGNLLQEYINKLSEVIK